MGHAKRCLMISSTYVTQCYVNPFKTGRIKCFSYVAEKRNITLFYVRRAVRRLGLKYDGTRAETRVRPSAKRTSPFKSAGASVQSTTGSRGVLIGGSNVGYTMFHSSVKSTGYPLHSPIFPSFPHPCVTVCHHISTGIYQASGRQDPVVVRPKV